MGTKVSINTTPRQTVRMNQRLMQSIGFICMSNMDFQEYIQSQLEDNICAEFIPSYSNNACNMDIYEKKQDLKDFLEGIVCQEDYIYLYALLMNMDDRGYLRNNVPTIAENMNLSHEQMERVRQVILHHYPYGIGSTDLRECLHIQLLYKENSHLSLKLIDCFSKEVEQRKYKKLCKLCNCNENDLQQALNIIKSCQPYPALSFSFESETIIRPDFKISYNQVDINIEPIKYFTINYINDNNLNDLSHMSQIKKSYQQVAYCESLIMNRTKFLEKVLRFLVQKQENYLFHGEHKEIITLKDVGIALNMHISTVSRIVCNHYYQLNDSIYSFTCLLDKGINGYSSTLVNDEIKCLIDSENKLYPLSDVQLQYALDLKDIHLSRREITLVRKKLGIGNSYERMQQIR